jgi:hypothetical protein
LGGLAEKNVGSRDTDFVVHEALRQGELKPEHRVLVLGAPKGFDKTLDPELLWKGSSRIARHAELDATTPSSLS